MTGTLRDRLAAGHTGMHQTTDPLGPGDGQAYWPNKAIA